MKIAKVINNNVVSVLKEGNQELVIMGRGIAFQKKTGDPVDEARIEKVFTLDNKDVSEKFKTLLYDIPIECMEVSEEIISYAKLQLGKKLNDSIYVSLTDILTLRSSAIRKGWISKMPYCGKRNGCTKTNLQSANKRWPW